MVLVALSIPIMEGNPPSRGGMHSCQGYPQGDHGCPYSDRIGYRLGS